MTKEERKEHGQACAKEREESCKAIKRLSGEIVKLIKKQHVESNEDQRKGHLAHQNA